MASYVTSIFNNDVKRRHYVVFTYALSLALLFSVVSCGGASSSGKNPQENKISSDLLKKMQMNQLTSTRGFKVAVKVKDGEDISDVLSSGNVRYKAKNLVNAVFVDLDRESVLNLAKDPRVEKVEENSDLKVNLLYATKQIGVRDPLVWGAGYVGATLGNTTNPSDKIRIAVVDTGIDDRHSDFCNELVPLALPPCTSSRIVKIANCYQMPECIEGVIGSGVGIDDHGHGSHVSGIILGNGASCDNTHNTASIELHGNLTDLTSATRYFFPSQFGMSSTGNMSADMTWTTNATTGASVAFQSKSDAEALNNNLLFTYTDQINFGPGITTPAPNPSADFIQSSNYTETEPAGTLIMPHAFVASTTDSNAVGKEFWASIKTSVQGWGDTNPRLAGVSYGSELVAVKSLGSSGTGNVDDIVRALEYVSSIAAANNIVAVNLSFSIGNGLTSEILKSAVRGLVSNGVAVVDSAGNDQQQGMSISSPGDEPTAITVGAVNDQNQVTIYTSVGSLSSTVTKPDVLAPGGSFITRNYIMAPKSTYIDTYNGKSQWNRTNGATRDSYALKIGTSQAAPFVTGLIGVMASKKTGGWTFGSSAMPLFYKMLICMTAFETGSRESSAIFIEAPITPERAGGLKDRVEGYGRIDARGAMSAIDDVVALSSLSTYHFSFNDNNAVYDQKSFVRAVTLSSEEEYNFSMSVPTGADYDLYLFNGTPDSNGEPILLASSALVNNPVERIVDFIPPSTGTYYLVAKWISGSGTTNFALDLERTKPATPTQISNLRIDRNMRDKNVTISWKTNVPAISKIQYGNTGGLGSEKSETSYGTDHSFSFDIAYNNYYYVRAISSSTGNTDLEISTAVSPVYRTSTYGVLLNDISVEDLPIVPNVGGCGTISDANSDFNSGGFGAIIGLLPLVLLVVIRRKLKQFSGR